MELLAEEIKNFLILNKLDHEISIYYDNICWKKWSNDTWVRVENVKASTVTLYANDSTITLIFEGPFYDIINFYHPNLKYRNKIESKFSKILKKYGYYYEIGESVSITLYPI